MLFFRNYFLEEPQMVKPVVNPFSDKQRFFLHLILNIVFHGSNKTYGSTVLSFSDHWTYTMTHLRIL